MNEGATYKRGRHQGASAPGLATGAPPTGPGWRLGTGRLWVQHTQVALGGWRRGHRGARHTQGLCLDSSGGPTLLGSLGSRHGVLGAGRGPSTHSEGHLESCAEAEGPVRASLQQAVWVTRCLETGRRGPGTIPVPTSPPLVQPGPGRGGLRAQQLCPLLSAPPNWCGLSQVVDCLGGAWRRLQSQVSCWKGVAGV